MTARPLVLVIEDSDDTRELYAVALRLEGLTVEEARDGQEALHKAVELLPDIIVTDLSMPVMDGWETIRRLRADDRTCRIPIIACSGEEAPSSLARRASPTGTSTDDCRADAVLPKPCEPDRLAIEVRRLLRRDPAEPGRDAVA